MGGGYLARRAAARRRQSLQIFFGGLDFSAKSLPVQGQHDAESHVAGHGDKPPALRDNAAMNEDWAGMYRSAIMERPSKVGEAIALSLLALVLFAPPAAIVYWTAASEVFRGFLLLAAIAFVVLAFWVLLIRLVLSILGCR